MKGGKINTQKQGGSNALKYQNQGSHSTNSTTVNNPENDWVEAFNKLRKEIMQKSEDDREDF